MNNRLLSNLSVQQLVADFVELGVAQDDALSDRDSRRYNRLFDRMQLLVQELKQRPGDQRRALMSLYDHPNLQVRLKAAKANLAVAYGPSRKVMEEIAECHWAPQGLEAGMSIHHLDTGIYKPT